MLVFFLLIFGSVIAFISCKSKTTTVQTAENKQLWTCSMHPEIIRDHPGACPICGMDLVKKVDNAVAINNIQLNDLLQPTDRFVVSSIPVTTIKKGSETVEVDALGTVAYDTRLVNTISARISGRIEKLYVKYRYQHIMKGQKIMDIYSPELLTTEQELLFVLKNDPSNTSLLNAARQKLLLLGVSESQLNQIINTKKPFLAISFYSNYSGHIHEAGNTMPEENTGEQRMDISRITEELSIKEGMYVEKGQNVFQIYNVNRSWVLLNFFPEYLGLIKEGDAVMVVPETAPSKKFRAKINFIEPIYRKENKTLTARAYFDNSQMQIPVGSQVKATIFVNTKETNWLPKDAVLSLGINKVAFIKVSGGFKAQKVEAGLTYNNQIQILSGLNATDSVAANAQFLTDSESFIKVNNQQ
jgi:Cu(I)/Ag(I) efflux system membrane fusion protein